MEQELIRFFADRKQNNGLLVAEAPTGYGKTYQTVRAIYRYLQEGGSQKFMFVTNLLKNLPVEELHRLYAADGREKDFDREVLVLANPVETISKVIDTVEVPSAFRTPAYEALRAGFERLNSYEKCEKSLRVKLEEEENRRLREELEPDFRRELSATLARSIPGGAARKKEAIRRDKQYQWIQAFYPSVFWNDAKILLLSVKKLMVRNIPLVEPGFPCLSRRMLVGRIVCIDEFDASKDVILKHLIEQALHMKVDYLELFRLIHGRMREHRPSRDMLTTRDLYEKKSRRTWAMLVEEAEQIYEYGALAYSLKTDDDAIDRGRNFLFHDNSYHTVLQEKKTHLRAVKDEERRQILIHFEDQATHEKHRGEPNIQLHSLLRDIHVFLQHFQSYVYGWGSVYAETVNKRRGETEDLYTSALAVESIYQDYGLTGKQVTLMTEELDRSGRWTGRNAAAPDLSFYESGFRFFEFIDDEHHHTKTDLQYVQMLNTPEKILLYLCEQTKVVGLSATAALPTVTGNYDLDYLRHRLRGRYRELSPETKERICQELQAQWKPYEAGKVRVELTLADADQAGMTTMERLTEIFGQAALARKYTLRLTGSVYHQKRYCNIFEAMKVFWCHRELRSFLCLNKMLPEAGKEKMDLELMRQVLEDLRVQFAPEDRGELCVLRSGANFEAEKDELLATLSRGEKRFIFSSYQTLGAGQNLQYPAPDREKLVHLLPCENETDSRFFKKDIDALYLGDDTHVAVTLNSDQPLGGEELLEFCFQAECLHESGEISRQALNQMVKEAVSSYTGGHGWSGKANAVLKNCPSLHRQVTRDMIQAVGRMNRTFLKQSTVYLMISEEALVNMDPACLRDRMLTPEMQALADLRESLGRKYCTENEARNRAERIADCGNRYIQRMLKAVWTPNSMELWRVLRDTVLSHPRADRKEWERDPVIQNYYIHLDTPIKRYYFAQKGDFSETLLSLQEDPALFRAGLEQGVNISEVSEEEARLQTVLAYPGMRQLFREQGWAETFGDGEYILSPVLFQNIYKGALGEVAGRFILEQTLSLQCRELEDPAQFEVFDYALEDGVYLDFKHWKPRTSFDERKMREKLIRKLDELGGKRALVINLISDGKAASSSTADGRLIEIPGLLLPDGRADEYALRAIREAIQ